MTNIIVAIISGLCVAIPSIIATISSNKKSNDLVIYRIDELDKKVHEHNNLIDRMYKVEKEVMDKDGVSAAAMCAEMILYWRSQGKSLRHRPQRR